jgi:hypothetical protein
MHGGVRRRAQRSFVRLDIVFNYFFNRWVVTSATALAKGDTVISTKM